MSEATKPKVENLEQQEAEELTPEQAEQAEGGMIATTLRPRVVGHQFHIVIDTPFPR